MGRLNALRTTSPFSPWLLPAALIFCLSLPSLATGQQAGPPSGSQGASQINPEAEQVFLGVLRAIQDYGLSETDSEMLWEKAIQGMIKELGDPYATVMSREEVEAFEEQSTGNYAGIGVQISELNAAVTITAVFPNTPADRAGLMVGDRIVGVDEETSNDWTVEDVSNRIRGEEGTSVTVRVARDGINRPIPHEITRQQVHVPAVRAERIFDDVGYVLVDRVARNSAAEVDSVLTELGESRGTILDLRRNPGGYLDESLRLADLFLERGDQIVMTKARNPGRSEGRVSEERAYARTSARPADEPLIILVDRFSASASEIIAGALQDHDRAIVLGERTFGKGTVQSVVPLPAGRLFRITSGEWFTPLGRSLSIPRDNEGRIIGAGEEGSGDAGRTSLQDGAGGEPETHPDSLPRFTSPAGRTLLGGGGVYPDLAIRGDTLTSNEQAFVSATVEAEIALTSRIQEAAFDASQATRQAGTDPDAPMETSVLATFVNGLMEDGLDGGLLTPDVRDYLSWRLSVAYYQRLEREHRALEVQSERDPVLATAIDMLKGANSLTDLFVAVERAGGVGGLSEDQARRSIGN